MAARSHDDYIVGITQLRAGPQRTPIAIARHAGAQQ
jgi:hypothetical protein